MGAGLSGPIPRRIQSSMGADLRARFLASSSTMLKPAFSTPSVMSRVSSNVRPTRGFREKASRGRSSGSRKVVRIPSIG